MLPQTSISAPWTLFLQFITLEGSSICRIIVDHQQLCGSLQLWSVFYLLPASFSALSEKKNLSYDLSNGFLCPPLFLPISMENLTSFTFDDEKFMSVRGVHLLLPIAIGRSNSTVGEWLFFCAEQANSGHGLL